MFKKILTISSIGMLIIACQPDRNLGNQEVIIGENYAQFAVPYAAADESNPFDVEAKATFTNTATNETKKLIGSMPKTVCICVSLA